MIKRLLAFLLAPILLAQAPQVTVTTRAGSGAPLSFAQADKNFTDLRDAVNNINAKVISAKDFGAKGDGTTNDATAINAALAALNAVGGGRLLLSPGTYILASAIDYPGNHISIEGAGIGHTTLKAKDNTAFEYMITGTGRVGSRLSDLTVDVNQANRFTALQAAGGGPLRAVGVNWTSPIDGRIRNVLVKNAVGNGTLPGVGIAIGGTGLRNIISNCTALDCGIPGYASDGIYTSGTQTLIESCIGKNCTDTAFVLEMSQQSGIVGSTAIDCSAGAAITSLSSGDCYGNYIDALTVKGWNSSVTGGVQIGALGTSNLVGTVINALTMYSGTGPALYFRKISSGRIVGTVVSAARIDTGSNQGILVDGADEMSILGASIKATTNACIQVQTGCTRVQAVGCFLSPTGPSTYGLHVTDGSDISVRECSIYATAGQMAYGIYFAGTGTRCYSLFNVVQGAGTAWTGADGTTTPTVVAPYSNGLSFNKAATTNLYDNSGALQTDVAFLSASTVKARGNLMEVGPTGPSSGNGGSYRIRNDAGTSSWLMGHLGSGGATAWVLGDLVAADYPFSVAQGAGGVITMGRPATTSGTFKAFGNLVEVGPTGASSGNGGSFRTRNDAGTSDWLVGHLGTASHTAFNIRDIVASDDPVSIATTTSGAITLGGTNGRKVAATGAIEIQTVGKSLGIKEGTNAKMGTATLVAGAVTVSTTAVAANSRIHLTGNADGGTPGWLRVSARTAGTSFTITSSSGTDTSTVAWVIFDPL